MSLIAIDGRAGAGKTTLAARFFDEFSVDKTVEVIHMETPTPVNAIGAKGIGESGTIGSTPAIQSAVVDAVSHLGVKHIEMPCTAERVWRAIQAAQ